MIFLEKSRVILDRGTLDFERQPEKDIIIEHYKIQTLVVVLFSLKSRSKKKILTHKLK